MLELRLGDATRPNAVRGLPCRSRALHLTGGVTSKHVEMPCGWGCGEQLRARTIREHFTRCPKRPDKSPVKPTKKESAPSIASALVARAKQLRDRPSPELSGVPARGLNGHRTPEPEPELDERRVLVPIEDI